MAILGGGPGSFEYALALHKLRPELHFRVCIDDPDQPLPESPDPAITVRHQSFTVVHDHPGGVTVMADSLDGSNPSEEELRFLLVDYNSYTLKTRVTDFLAGSPVVRRAGYIVADSKGRTALPGILAAGNIVTPISGVLTALDTGFKAGLTIYDRLHMDRFGESPIVFPWLPLSGLESHPLYESVYGPDAEQE